MAAACVNAILAMDLPKIRDDFLTSEPGAMPRAIATKAGLMLEPREVSR